MDDERANYDESDPPEWPGYVSSLMLPFVVATALVAVGFLIGFVIHVGMRR